MNWYTPEEMAWLERERNSPEVIRAGRRAMFVAAVTFIAIVAAAIYCTYGR